MHAMPLHVAFQPAVATPRGARWAAAAFAAVYRAGRSLFAPSTPAVVSPAMLRTIEANELRDYAAAIAKTDPGFAADLFAAADRHELQA